MTLTHLERLFAALYVSEVWYALWTSPYARLYHKARAMVVYDRVLTGRLDPHAEGSSSTSWYGRSQPVTGVSAHFCSSPSSTEADSYLAHK